MSDFVYFLFLFVCSVYGRYDDKVLPTKKYAWFENFKEMEAENDQCEFAVANAAHQLLKVCEKAAIDNLNIHYLDSPVGNVPKNVAGNDDMLHRSSRPERVDIAFAFDYCMNNLDLSKMSQEHAFMWCLKVSLWQYNHYNKLHSYQESNLDEETDNLEILQVSDSPSRQKRSSRFLRRRIAPRNMKRPRSGFRTRQEYRTLSLSQRKRFHDALNKLYEDGTIDCFSKIHRSAMIKGGYMRSVTNLMWHRAFVTLFEEALRQVDDSVSIPYWDSSIDNNMAQPGLSVIWDDKHLGTSKGVVDAGPFAKWNAVKAPLRRDVSRGGRLMSKAVIDSMMTYCRFLDFNRRLINAGNGVHRWVGGTMGTTYAASDPLFYMHYAFLDYIWVKFQLHQKEECDINPELDYPPTSDKINAPKTKMIGMKFLRNVDGIASYWTSNWYNYKESPSCATKCEDSPDLFCDPKLNLCTGEIVDGK